MEMHLLILTHADLHYYCPVRNVKNWGGGRKNREVVAISFMSMFPLLSAVIAICLKEIIRVVQHDLSFTELS